MNALIRPRRVLVQRARHQLLAGAALAVDEDRRPARRRLDDQVEDLPHARAAADDVVEAVCAGLQVLFEGAILGDQAPLCQGVPEDDQHLVVLERLGDVVVRASLHRGDGVLDRRERRDHQHRQVVVDLPDLVQRRDAVHARQHHVDDGCVERHRAQQIEPLVGRRRQANLVTLSREERVENLAHDLLIVDDENDAVGRHVRVPAARAAVVASGSCKVNRVPCPGVLSQVIAPPCSCTMPYVIDRPRPVPLPIAFVVKNGS